MEAPGSSTRSMNAVTAFAGPETSAMRTAGGRCSSRRSASWREAYPAGSMRTRAPTMSSWEAVTTTTPPSWRDRTRAAAANQRDRTCPGVRSPSRCSCESPSSSSAVA
ncbi:hypothetical protein ACFFX0_05210 [Citricoccus parietis]|uniref:Uncharacterized protein n=1 Tax=Citricoccus parietis TaxID=592307 RepID=A0ABV5FVB0_9MICC